MHCFLCFLLQDLGDAGNHRQVQGEQADPKTLDMMQTSSPHTGGESQAQDAGEGEESSPGNPQDSTFSEVNLLFCR